MAFEHSPSFLTTLLLLTTLPFLTTIMSLQTPSPPLHPPTTTANEIARNLWSTPSLNLYQTSIHSILRCHCPTPTTKPIYRLLYIPIRNRGEILRLLLESACVPYEVEVVGWKEWIEGVKLTTPEGKCPVLRDVDGSGDLGQEGAITRFLARELGYDGCTSRDRAAVDSLYCLWFSTMRNNGVSHDGQGFSIASLKRIVREGGEVRRPRYEDVQRLQALEEYSKAENSLMILDFFERKLEASTTGLYLVGEGRTYVDLGLFYILFELAEEDNVPDFSERFGLPCLGRFLEATAESKGIREYIVSEGRMPRYTRAEDGTSLYRFVEGRGSKRVV